MNGRRRAKVMIVGAIAAMVFAWSCGRGDRGSQDTDAGAVEEARAQRVADSLKAEEARLNQPFKDTVYASASHVKVVLLTVKDSTDDGVIRDLRDTYANAAGALTFRSGPRRDARFDGLVDGRPTDIEVLWTYKTDRNDEPTDYGRWGGGTGWTGQPLYIEWPDRVLTAQKKSGAMTAGAGKREVIVASLDGRVHFINFDTGEASRTPVETGGNPVKGTPSLDPTLNGNLYVGQGVAAAKPFGAMVVDLNKHAVTDFMPEDRQAYRGWGAYDSSPVRVGRFLFRPGENGIVYKYTVEPGHLKLHSKMTYTVDGKAPGIEASMAVYRNYGYIGDNAGNVICLNLNTLRPVWHYALGDDIDATLVVAEEDGQPYLYVCCEVDKQGEGMARMAKLRADNGQEVWLNEREAVRHDEDGKHFDGGYYSTPLLGTADCDSLIFGQCVINADERRNGVFVAMNRKTGKDVYTKALKTYGWSSPAALTDRQGHMYVFVADCYGWCYVLEGRTGEVLARRHVGHNFESSPVVVGNTVVIGERGERIFRLRFKV